MSRIRKNIAANFVGSLWTALVSLLFIPIYLHFLGVEAYGLVTIFTTLLAMFAVLDMGLIQTLTREVARLVVLPDSAREMRDLLRTLEIPYVGMGLMIGLGVVLIAPWLAHEWVNNEALSTQSVESAVILMGLMIAIQWPLGFYSGGLVGLQEQVVLNLVNGAIALVRGMASALVLWQLAPTIEAFFWTQLLASLAHILIVSRLLWRKLPADSQPPRFRIDLLRTIWRFAAGVTGIGLISSLLMQLDKIILSKLLSLEVFGYYAIANVVSMNVYRLFGPIYSAIYPRLTNLVASGSRTELAAFYHKSAQFLSVAVFPAVAILVFFPNELLLIWLQNPVAADAAAPLVSILVVGTAFNGIMHVPYGLQLAAGWTSLALRFGVISVVVFGILLVVLTESYGVVGAAMAWPIQQALYVVFTVTLMHRRLLPGEQWRWYFSDLAYPLLLALAPVVLAWQLKPDAMGMTLTLLYLFATYIASLAAALMGLSAVQQAALETWRLRLRSK
jgi:O-antigen/teichoic acid export membrane protein